MKKTKQKQTNKQSNNNNNNNKKTNYELITGMKKQDRNRKRLVK